MNYILVLVFMRTKNLRYATIVIPFYIEYSINYQKNGYSHVKTVL